MDYSFGDDVMINPYNIDTLYHVDKDHFDEKDRLVGKVFQQMRDISSLLNNSGGYAPMHLSNPWYGFLEVKYTTDYR